VPMWGMTQAPLLYRDTVVVAPQTQKTGLVAYDITTGQIRWRSDYIGRNWYSHVSPSLANLCGVDQIVMVAQPSDPEKSPDKAPPAIVASVDPASGAILWTNVTPRPYKIPISQPLSVGGDRLFITGGYGLGCLFLQVSHPGERWETRWQPQKKTAAAHIHSPVFYRDRLYVMSFKEHGAAATGLVCLNLEGETVWQTGPDLLFDSGACLVADGMAFVMHGKSGELHLFDLLSFEAPKLLAKAKVLAAENAMVWAPLALSQGKLLARDQHQLRCFEVRSK
jgi:outer membrane protein assembly factor BamB